MHMKKNYFLPDILRNKYHAKQKFISELMTNVLESDRHLILAIDRSGMLLPQTYQMIRRCCQKCADIWALLDN